MIECVTCVQNEEKITEFIIEKTNSKQLKNGIMTYCPICNTGYFVNGKNNPEIKSSIDSIIVELKLIEEKIK